MPTQLPGIASNESNLVLFPEVMALPWMNPGWNRTSGGGLTSPVGIADGGTGQTSQTNAFDALAPTTTKGDLIACDGTDNVRKAVGTDGYILTADSSDSTGVSWKALSGTGGGGGSGGATIAQAARLAHYKPFTSASADDDEFDDQSFSGSWTAVNSGSHLPTLTEDNDVLSIDHPGSDATGELHAWMKAKTINSNDYVEGWFSFFGRAMSAPSVGVIMANGNTYGAGTQVFFELFYINAAAPQFALASHTNYSTAGTSSAFGACVPFRGSFGLRLQYLGSNNWAGFFSIDGISWRNITGTLSRTMTPTHAGFFVSTWAGALPVMFNAHYCRFSS